MLGPCHVTRMRIQAALLKAAIDEGSSWHLALEVRSLHEEGHEPGPHMSLVHTCWSTHVPGPCIQCRHFRCTIQ